MTRIVLKSKVKSNVRSVSRTAIINLLRQELLKRAGDADVSACKVAADQGIFCHGFSRYTDLELRRRYDWIAKRRPKISRAQLEEIADRWQIARQQIENSPVACDAQQKFHDACKGWDDFTNDDLARYYFEMTGKELVVA
jgi:hypothetical protein